MTAPIDSIEPPITTGVEQSDFDKLRRLPFVYAFNVVNTAALLCTVNAPLPLYAAELGVSKDGIGLLGGILPFAQILCIAFLPVVMRFGHRKVTAIGYGSRYIFVLPFLIAPIFIGSPDIVFWILFGCMVMFASLRTLAETAIYPWSQEYTPRFVRGQVSGATALLSLPSALLVSLLVKLWLDGHTGIERFFPVFLVGIVLGTFGASLLFGVRGGKPSGGDGRAAIRNTLVAARDRNFLTYLFSSGTQYLAYSIINLFMVLYFHERLGMSSGDLVLMSALIPLGAAAGGLTAGWFVDRYGTRPIRTVLQTLQVVLIFILLGCKPDMPGLHIIVGGIFVMFGLLFQSAIAVGSIYMLNYVPPARKESFMAVAYTSDGLIAGTVTFAAGALLGFLEQHPAAPFGVPIGNYEMVFGLCAFTIVLSAIAFGRLKEEGATGVRAFLRQFRQGDPIRALWGIRRYGSLTSEERRRELTYFFGGTKSGLVKEELIAALSDPSFDVRHEAIQSLGHLPRDPAVVAALEGILSYDGLVELQYAALESLGRLRAAESGQRIARFLDDPNSLLRARAARTLGDIRDRRYLPRIRQMLANDPEIDGRLAAASALGKFKDAESVDGLVGIYRELAADQTSIVGEPRSKVVLLALAKILGVEESFSLEWRREERIVGYRLPSLLVRLSRAVRRGSSDGAQQHSAVLLRAADRLAVGDTSEAFRALQSLRPSIAASQRPDAQLVLKVMDGTRDIAEPHRALLILLCLIMRPQLVG